MRPESRAIALVISLVGATTVACVPEGCSDRGKVTETAITTKDTLIRSNPTMELDGTEPMLGKGETVTVTARYACTDGTYAEVNVTVLYGGSDRKVTGFVPQEHLTKVRNPEDS